MSAKDEAEKEDQKEDMKEDAPPATSVPVTSTRPDAPVVDHEARARLIAQALAAQDSGR